jgi:hypothetical protein
MHYSEGERILKILSLFTKVTRRGIKTNGEN